MKITFIKSLPTLALTCAALAIPQSLFADFVVSTFDSDLGSNPYGTNLWTDTTVTAMTWTNSGNPGGSMYLVSDWALGTPEGGAYQWEESQLHLRPWDAATNADRGLDIRYYQSIDFDVRLLPNCMTNLNGDCGGFNVAFQGDPYWGINPSNGIPWTNLRTVSPSATNTGWQHFSIPTTAFQGTLSEIIFQRFNWANSNNTMHTEELIDNVRLVSAVGPPPLLHYTKANRGLNIWSTGGSADRNSIRTVQDGGTYYMWPDVGSASYSFTIANYPSEPARTELAVRMYLVPTIPGAGEGAPDWNEPTCLFTELNVDSSGIATWMLHWKTNAPNDNGQYYNANSQIQITNPTPIGKWTLAFSDLTHATMTTPSGNSTNFVLGGSNIPYISPAFYGYGLVYIGLFGSTNTGDLSVDFGGAQLGGFIAAISNNWTADTNMTAWEPVAGAPYYLVPTNNASWVTWNLPDGGFFLQTNTVQPGAALNWSTNHGLPSGTILALHKAVLVKPGDLPNTPRLFFRLSRPGF
jgi:hypothetical protein